MKARRDRVLTLIARTSRFIPSRVMKERLRSPYGRGVNSTTHRGAAAYAAWAGKELPTEAQWKYPARGGLESKIFCLGGRVRAVVQDDGQQLAGRVPLANQMLDGYERASPVKRFPPNGYGLFDVAGNAKPQAEHNG